MLTNRLACRRLGCHAHHVFCPSSRSLLAARLARIARQTAIKSLPVLLVLLGCAPDEVVLAKIADSAITEAELAQFVARLPKHLRSAEPGIEADREYLESMIDQELLLLEAKSRGLDTTAALGQQMEDVVRRRLAARYQREVIASKIDIGPKEIERAFHDMGFHRERLLHRVVVGGSQQDAQVVLNQLAAGSEFADLARAHAANDAKADSNGAIGWIGLTQLKHFLIPQREFLALPVDKPVLLRLSPGAYQIIRFAADREAQLQTYQEEIVKLLHREQWWRRTEEEVELLSRAHRVQFHAEGVQALIQRVEKRQSELSAEQARQPLFTFADGSVITAANFLTRLRKLGRTPAVQDSARIVAMAEQELLHPYLFSLAARERGWHEEAGFIDWRSHTYTGLLLDRLMQLEVEDHLSLAEADLRAYYQANRDRFRTAETVRIAEVHVPDEATAKQLRDEIERGAEFAAILQRAGVASHGIHKRGGEMILQPHLTGGFPELVEAAFAAQEGELVGPVYLEKPNSYAIFRVLQRQQSRIKSFAEARKPVEYAVRLQQRDTLISGFFRALRNQYADRIVIFADRLEQRHQGQ